MTNNHKYEEVIFNLAELLKSKNFELYMCNSRIKTLEEKLEQLERR